jgi:hypothetical protein
VKKILICSALLLIGVPVLILLVLLGWEFTEVLIKATEVYELPQGYRGWAIIQYGVPHCPGLERLDGKIIHKFPSSGCLCTSSPPPEGFHSVKYEYVSPDGTRTKIPGWTFWVAEPGIWDGTTTTVEAGGTRFVQEVLFVGSKKEFHAKANPAPNSPPIASPTFCDQG